YAATAADEVSGEKLAKTAYSARGSRRSLRARLLVLTAVPLLCWLSFRAAVAWWPYPRGLDRLPAAGTFIEDRDGHPLAAFVTDDGQWRLPLPKDQISPHLLAAVVAVEDARFYAH